MTAPHIWRDGAALGWAKVAVTGDMCAKDWTDAFAAPDTRDMTHIVLNQHVLATSAHENTMPGTDAGAGVLRRRPEMHHD